MNLQHLRAVYEIVAHGMSVTGAAQALNLAQPGVSRQLKELEEELGVQIFERSANRILGLSAAGREIHAVAQRILGDVESVRKIASEHAAPDSGDLTIATTNTHARYTLPPIIEAFSRKYPKVSLTLRQGTPLDVCELIANGDANFAICTQTAAVPDSVVQFPIYRIAWDIIAAVNHPILKQKPITLETVSRYPLVVHDGSFSGFKVVARAFEKSGRAPRVVLNGVHSDVSKAYVERGLGLAMLSKVAYDKQKDRNIRLLNLEHLFETSVLALSVKRGAFLRSYAYTFISLYAPHLQIDLIKRVAAGQDVHLTSLGKSIPLLTRAF